MSKLIISKNIEPPYSFRILFPHIFNFFGGLSSIKLFVFLVLTIYFFIVLFTIIVLDKIADLYLLNFKNKFILIPTFLFSQVFFQTSYVIDDFFIFLIFLLILFYSERLDWIRIYFFSLISVLCRPQSIYFLLFSFIILYLNKQLNVKNFIKIFFLIIISISSYITITFIYKSEYIDVYTFAHHIENNTKYFLNKILPVWGVLGTLLLYILYSYKKIDIKQRYFILATLPYTFIFFIKGNLWELDKYFPAIFIFLISFFNLKKDLN